MLLRLYCSSTDPPAMPTSEQSPLFTYYNEGFDRVMYLLWFLQRRGVAIEILDTSTLPEEELKNAYFEAQFSSVSKKLKIRNVFGTKHKSGFRFGKEVPALLVHEEGEQHPVYVYPHEVLRERGKMWDSVTIEKYLNKLIRQQAN